MTSPRHQFAILQGGVAVARLAHNQEVVGANPTPASRIPGTNTDRRLSGIVRVASEYSSLLMDDLARSNVLASAGPFSLAGSAS